MNGRGAVGLGPECALPLPAEFNDVDEYVESLLKFATSSWMLQTLCGGVHILDFYTRSPNLYASLLPQHWRAWLRDQDMMDILDLLMRDDLSQFEAQREGGLEATWRGRSPPPADFVEYLQDVRKHLLCRTFSPRYAKSASKNGNIARNIAMGMKVKKVHEVDNFARYVDKLTADIAAARGKEITHLVDFGSGQNYLGRALAAPPYSKHIIAVESKQHNIEGAKNMDVLAKLVPKPLVMRNKKEYRAELKKRKGLHKCGPNGCGQGSDGEKTAQLRDRVATSGTMDQSKDSQTAETEAPMRRAEDGLLQNESSSGDAPTKSSEEEGQLNRPQLGSASPGIQTNGKPQTTEKINQTMTTTLQIYTEGHGSVQYVEHRILDGDLSDVVDQVLDSSQVQGENVTATSNGVEEPSDINNVPKSTTPDLMVMSLHSCGNLVHHGLRSLILNPAISAVAMVGCCYNMVTERLGPPTYKLPTLRPNHPRLVETSNACDPHGFPMSERLANYELPLPPSGCLNGGEAPRGVRFNITARMMGVQAPQNWGRQDSEMFFTRHFYRALLQRIFLDRGIVSAPVDDGIVGGGVSAAGHTSKVLWPASNGRGPGLSSDGTSAPLTIGTLRKFAYKDFVSYVRAAVQKLTTPNDFCEVDPEFIASRMAGLTDEEILDYEHRYQERKKELSVMWSLMAYSAGVVEAVIVVDRWLWLKEQKGIRSAWVEPVFDYSMSPRNLVVVGVKE